MSLPDSCHFVFIRGEKLPLSVSCSSGISWLKPPRSPSVYSVVKTFPMVAPTQWAGGHRHGAKTSRTLSANTSRTYVFKGFKVVYPRCQPNWFSCQQPLRAIATGLLMRKPIGRPYDGQGVFIEVRRHKVSAMSWHRATDRRYRGASDSCHFVSIRGEKLPVWAGVGPGLWPFPIPRYSAILGS